MTNGDAVVKPKVFVLDTNVLIHKPDAIVSFRDNEVVIPLWVLEELDRLKTFSDEKGRSARQAIRFLDEQSRRGDLTKGVKVGKDTIVRVVTTHSTEIPSDLLQDKTDNKIILAALALQNQGYQVFFVSKDINARVKATTLGLRAMDYEKQKVNFEELYAGWKRTAVSEDTLKEFKSRRRMAVPEKLHPNEFVILNNEKAADSVKGSAIGRYKSANGTLNLVGQKGQPVMGIKPLNQEQVMAFNLLMDDDIPLVTLVGKAGTGKTLLAIAAGLYGVVEKKQYTRLLVSRPVIPMGKDIGYLPGDKDAKLAHWMQPLFDNLDLIIASNKKEGVKSVEWLTHNRLLELEALTYIRGRSLPGQFIIIDEAQNLSPHEIKTVVSRAGKGTKVVLTGDPYQIDSPYLDANSNGLTYLVEALKGQELFGHIILEHTERSPLAEMAAELL
jgi:PhoH-like ATPase